MCKDATRDNHYFKGAHTSLGQVIMFVNGIIRESVDSSSFAGFQKFPGTDRATNQRIDQDPYHALFFVYRTLLVEVGPGYSLSLWSVALQK